MTDKPIHRQRWDRAAVGISGEQCTNRLPKGMCPPLCERCVFVSGKGIRCKAYRHFREDRTQSHFCTSHLNYDPQDPTYGPKIEQRNAMPAIYGEYLGPKLSERIDSLLKHDMPTQLTLFEELAILRNLAGEKLSTLAKLSEIVPEVGPDGMLTAKGRDQQELITQGTVLAEGSVVALFREVERMAKTTTGILETMRGHTTAADVGNVVDQLVVIMHDTLKENGTLTSIDTDEIVRAFADNAVNNLRLVHDDIRSKPTDLTPEETVLLMDQSVPVFMDEGRTTTLNELEEKRDTLIEGKIDTLDDREIMQVAVDTKANEVLEFKQRDKGYNECDELL